MGTSSWLRFGLMALLAAMCAACGSDYAEGDLVLANYEQRNYAYAAKVTAIGDDEVTVQYLDESSETLPESAIRKFDWDDDSKLECAYQRGDTYLPGEIDDWENPKLRFVFESGEEEDTDIAMCRELTGEAEAEVAQAAASGSAEGASCLSTQRDCSGVCVNISDDDDNCGSCGYQCQDGKSCDGHGFCRDAEGNL